MEILETVLKKIEKHSESLALTEVNCDSLGQVVAKGRQIDFQVAKQKHYTEAIETLTDTLASLAFMNEETRYPEHLR